MKQWAPIVASVIIIICGGSGYYIAQQRAEQTLEAVKVNIQKNLGPHGSFNYGSSSTSIWSQSAILYNVQLITPNGIKLTAESLNIKPKNVNAIDELIGKKIQVTSNQLGQVNIASMVLHDMTVAPDALKQDKDGHWVIYFSKFLLLDADFKGIAWQKDAAMYTIGSWYMDNYGIGRQTNINIKQIEADFNGHVQPVEKAKIDHVSATKLDLALILSEIEQGTYNIRPIMDLPEGETAQIQIHGGIVQGSEQDLLLKEANVEAKKIDEAKTQVKLHLDDLILPLDKLPNPELKELGYKQFHISVSEDINYSKTDDTYELKHFVINLKDMFKLKASGQLMGGVGENKIAYQAVSIPDFYGKSEQNSQEMLQKALSNIKIVSLQYHLQDEGLIDKIFEAAAKTEDTSAQKMKDQAIQVLRIFSIVQQGNHVINQACQAAAEVIQNPSLPLIIKVNPPHPVLYTEIVQRLNKKDLSVLEELGVTIQAGEGPQ